MSLVKNVARRQHSSLELVREIGALRQRGYSIADIALKTDFSEEYISALCYLLDHGEDRCSQPWNAVWFPLALPWRSSELKTPRSNWPLPMPERRALPGKQVLAIRRIVEQRNKLGKAVHGICIAPSAAKRKVTAEIFIRACPKETDKQKLMDDEAFTYNKRANRLASVQEHFMIVCAIERGVSEEKLARALNTDIKLIQRRRLMLNGISADVVELFKGRPINHVIFEVLRKMKSARRLVAANLMITAGNYRIGDAKPILAGTNPKDLVKPDPPKKIAGLTSEQMTRMERKMEALQRDFKAVEASKWFGRGLLEPRL